METKGSNNSRNSPIHTRSLKHTKGSNTYDSSNNHKHAAIVTEEHMT